MTVIKGYIDGATTLLCIPAKKSPIKVMQLIVKKGWFHSDVKNDTWEAKTLEERIKKED